MAYDEYLADRIRQALTEKRTPFKELKMMGGLCFMVNDKMCVGIHFDTKFGDNLIMARIGEFIYEQEVKKHFCLPMDFTGRPMKGFVFITPEGFDTDTNLEYWIQLCLDYNPIAKSSKKRK